MNPVTVRQLVRGKIADGLLPRDRIGSVSATNGTNTACDACSAPVSPEEVLYKIAREGSGGFVFHASCFAIWRTERNSMTSARAALD